MRKTPEQRTREGWTLFYAVTFLAGAKKDLRRHVVGGEVPTMQDFRSTQPTRTMRAGGCVWMSRPIALLVASAFSEPCEARVTRVWWRKKPKPKPLFKSGDHVILRGVVQHGGRDGDVVTLLVNGDPSDNCYVYARNLRRVARPAP